MTEKSTKKKSQPTTRPDSTALAVQSGGLSTIFDDLFEPFFQRPMSSFWSELDRQQPSFDLQDRGDHFSLTAQLPGYSKEEVEVRIDSNSLELKAEKKVESKGKKEGAGVVQRSFSSLHRYLTLPEQVVADKADGTMKNGILELKLPKRQQKPGGSPRRVDLK
ncbi:MAG: Hsp20/alpha crystallin family protein [Thaumarchaeota archaeon]|nr:Hsp20/alpha crystallin family protein [Nitrososphaerota archaeon]